MTDRRRLWEVMEPTDIERYALVGMAISHVQIVEGALRSIMTYVFQKGDKLTLAILEAQTAAERTKTLGYFIAELRKRVGLHPGLEAKLASFLERRNMIAHRLDEVPGWEKGVDGYQESYGFFSNLVNDSHELALLFSALIMAWQKQAMPDAQVPNEERIAEMAGHYTPILNDLFFEKE